MLVGVKCGCQQRGTIHVHKVLVTAYVVGVAVGVTVGVTVGVAGKSYNGLTLTRSFSCHRPWCSWR